MHSRSVRQTLLVGFTLALLALAGGVQPAGAKDFVLEDWDGPAPVRNWFSNPSLDTKGWTPVLSDSRTFSTWTGATSWAPKGLYASAGLALFAGPGTGEWQWQAPGTSTVYRAEYGPVITRTVGCVNEGMRTSSGAWQPSVNGVPGGAGRTSAHPTACTPGAWVPWTPSGQIFIGALGRQVFCSTAGCARTGSPSGNRAVFGVQRTRAVQPRFDAYLPGARLYVTDYDKPTITAGTNTLTGWVRTGTGTAGSTATDTGLGVKTLAITAQGLAGPLSSTKIDPCAGDRNGRCPATWNTGNTSLTASLAYNVDQLPEGVNTFAATAIDIVENASTANTIAIPSTLVDRTAPTGIASSGPLVEDEDRYFDGQGPVSVTVAATDPNSADGQQLSGIKTIRIETADGQTLASQTRSCNGSLGRCPATVSEDLAADLTVLSEGTHEVRVAVIDRAGNETVGTGWPVYIDRTGPAMASGAIEVTDFDAASGQATLGVSVPDDPALPDGSAGSGVASCEYKIGPNGSWTALGEEGITTPAQAGTTLAIELRCSDSVGNDAQAAQTVTVEASDPPDVQDFPVADAANATLVVRPWTKSDYNPTYTSDAAMPDMPVSYRRVGDSGAIGVLANGDGEARLNLPAGEYEVWLPQTVDSDSSEPRRVSVALGSSTVVEVAVDLTGGASSSRAPASTLVDTRLATAVEGLIREAWGCARYLRPSQLGFCRRLRALVNRVYAIEATLWGIPLAGLRDTTRMNAFQHSFATAYALRLAQVDYSPQFPNGIGPDTVLDIVFAIEDEPRNSSDLATRRASFQDRNNNNVGFNFQVTHQHYSAPMLCSSMRSKSFNARRAQYPDGEDRIPGNPSPRDQTRLIYNLNYGAAERARSAATFPNSRPCTYAFRRTAAP